MALRDTRRAASTDSTRERGNRELGLRIRRRRNQLGLSQEALAHRVGRSEGWLLQVENGRTDPAYSDLVNLAAALELDTPQLIQSATTSSVQSTSGSLEPHESSTQYQRHSSPSRDQHLPLASAITGTPNLTGRWWAAWQTFNQGHEIVATQPIQIDQHGLVASVTALERSAENLRGGYLWEGQLRLCENYVLLGWYTATDQNVRSRGTMYFVLHPQGNLLEGRWTGTSYDGPLISGWSAIAFTQEEAATVVGRMKSADHSPG